MTLETCRYNNTQQRPHFTARMLRG